MLEGFERLERVAADANEAGGSILDRLPSGARPTCSPDCAAETDNTPRGVRTVGPAGGPVPQVALAWAEGGCANAIDDGLMARAKDR